MTAEKYKNLSEAFNTADFGEYTAEIFAHSPYGKPKVYPSGSHPRVLFSKDQAKKIRKNLSADESAHAYKMYMELSEREWDGKFVEFNAQGHNFESGLAAIIEAKAFRYAMTGESSYGYEAIYAAKNAILTLNVPHTVGDWCRRHSYLMYVVGCTYDWCYDLMTEEDKRQIIAGCVTLLGVHFEMCCYAGEGNLRPTEQSTIYGHGAEDQLLVDYLAFAIASYDEAPEIYEFVAGRLLNDYSEAQSFLFSSGSHWEGAMYGSVRTAATIVSNLLFYAMTDGELLPFENVEEAIITLTYYIRPDGQVFRIGDINENKTFENFQFVWMANCCFYAGNLYKNAYLKSVAYKYLKGFKSFNNMVAGLSAVQFLVVNDPEVPHIYEGAVPLIRTTKHPFTNLFAKSANDDKNAFGIYMTMPETFSYSHSHAECGSFQIFYKGALASDSGAYARWGGEHHMGYNMQTISSNSLLIFNQNLAGTRDTWRKNLVYCGGQSIVKGVALPERLPDLLSHKAFGQCTSLGIAGEERDGKYHYSYMAGDMTKAYDAETASEVCRYMLALSTGDESCPLVFLTFDRITSAEASFKKTALIHVQEEPKLTHDGFAIITNTKGENHGKMVVQSVGFDTEYTVVGGEGKEFWVIDRNIPTGITLVKDSIAEYGWGRLEITPKHPEKTNHILNVMYVTDAENTGAPIGANDIGTEDLAGAEIFGKQIFFPKNEKLLTSELEFNIIKSGECFVAGVSAGKWIISKDGKTLDTIDVKEGTNLVTFKSDKGSYKLKPIN